jgi:hypothetical protein
MTFLVSVSCCQRQTPRRDDRLPVADQPIQDAIPLLPLGVDAARLAQMSRQRQIGR